MKFVEESEGAFSAAQLAAAERELEQQKKEWELDRLRALREEEERRMRLADDDEKPLTFGREDAQNQVNSASNSKKLVSKKPVRRRNSRKNNKATQESESETETTTESESESQEDVVEDSLDEESSHTESQSQGDEDEEEEEEEESNDQNDSEKGGYPKRKNRSNKSFSQNHFDLNSPRTRSRGNVKINLWTLDVSPILPGIKPKCRGRASNLRKQRELEMRMKAEESFVLPLPPVSSPKKLNNTSNKFDEEQSTDLNCVNTESNKTSPVKETPLKINHYTNSTSSTIKFTKTATTEESNSISCLDSMESETHFRSCDSSDASERCRASESDVKDDSSEVTQDLTDTSGSSSRSTHKSTVPCSNSEEDANSNEDSENSDVNMDSQSNSNSSAEVSGTLKTISLSNSITLEINEEIDISENSLTAPVKNKMIIQDTKESSKECVTENLNKSPVIDTSSVVDETNDQLNAEPSVPTAESKTVESKNIESENEAETKESVDVEAELTDKKQTDRSGSNLDVKNESVNDNIINSVIERNSSQEFSNKDEKCTKLEEPARDQDEMKAQPSSSDDTDNNSTSDTPKSSNPSESESEGKHKFRKPDPISYGITTRSARLNQSVESTESKHSEDSSDKQNEATTVHRKEVNKVAPIRRPDTPRPIEPSRVTRSSAGRSLTPPPPRNGQSPTKSIHRRRPDTPLPDCLKSSPRPATRSMTSASSPVRNEEQNASYEKPTTRSSKIMDNGFLNPALFRRSRSIPSMKPTSDSKDPTAPVSTRSKRISDSACVNTSTMKRRPDTPVPTFEQMSRVTRSGLNFTLNSGKSSGNYSGRGSKHARKTDSSSESKVHEDEPSSEKMETSSTDSNGNDVASESLAKQEESKLPPLNDEKPQRTAKVVAILTLDTRSNHIGKASSSVHSKSSNCNSSDAKGSKKNADSSNSNSTPDSPGKNCVLRISDVASNCKLDGWHGPGLDGTYANNKTGKSSTANKVTSSALNSKLKTDKVPLQSTVIALVDLDNDSNYDSSDGSKRLRRKIKRTRLTSYAKSLIKTNESQMNDPLDDKEEQIPPLKKSVRSQLTPPTPPSSQSTQLEKIGGNSIS